MARKIALLLASDLWFSPYVGIYTTILDEVGAEYDIISWDRYGRDTNEGYSYKKIAKNNPLSKFMGYCSYVRYVKKILGQNRYEKVIVFTSQLGIFCADFLEKNYKDNYIFDFRDLSIEQSWAIKKNFVKLLSNSYANVISSPGFKQYLPKSFDYVLSHNFNIKEVYKGLLPIEAIAPSDTIGVLTIGGIRSVETQRQIINALGDKDGFKVDYVGHGVAVPALEKHVGAKGYENVAFHGYYKKEDEGDIIKKSHILNIYQPKEKLEQTSLTNRFYNALIYRRPMITTKGHVHGNYCEKYNLGLAVDDTNGLDVKIKEWFRSQDFDEFQNSCIDLLKEFVLDYEIFKAMLLNFILDRPKQ